MSFFEELKRRNVFRVGIAYSVTSWVLIQALDIFLPTFGAPEWVMKIVSIVILAGFPVALIIAWAFELTPEGIKTDYKARRMARPRPAGGRRIDRFIVLALALAIVFLLVDRFMGQDSSTPTVSQTSTSDTLVPPASGQQEKQQHSIAVLPFENFSGNREDEYFADGLADTLLHKLAQISDLKVIARNSSFQFKGTNRDVREIGEILGVETILEGSVQRAGEQVRIIVQLVQSSDGAHIWSETFDDSMSNIFELQDRVASRIVDQFQFSLSEADRRRLMRSGTRNPEAYDLMIQALNQPRNMDELTDSSAEEDEKIRLLKQAIEKDPDYAMAWAHLSRTYNGLAWAADSAVDHDRYVAASEEAALTAFNLDPDLPDSHNALGWVAHRRAEKLTAAKHFRKALEIDPNYLEAMSGLALQTGWSNPQEALDLLNRSHELDPTSTIVYRQKHFALLALGRTEDAIEQLKLAIELDPEDGIFYNDLVDQYERLGRPDEGARYTSKLLVLSPDSFTGQMAMAEAWLAAGDLERTAEWIDILMNNRSDSDTAKLLAVERLVRAREYRDALDSIESVTRSNETMENLAIRRLASCIGLKQKECVTQQAGLFQGFVERARTEGGSVSPEFIHFAAIAQMLANELSDPDFDPKPAATTLLDDGFGQRSRFFGLVYFARAGLQARVGEFETAMEILETSVNGIDGNVFNADLFGMAVEDSMFLRPLRNQAGFAQWQERHDAQREAMLERMIQMESRGEILRAAAVKGMLD